MALSWQDQLYRIIKITGGNDLDDVKLVQFIQENALQLINLDISKLENYEQVAPGNHTLSVIAKSDHYEDSDPSITIQYTKLPTISNESISGNNYTFTEVSNATEYEIYADNGEEKIFLGTYIPSNN